MQQRLSRITLASSACAAVALLLVGVAGAQTKEKRTTYRWVDDKGVVHYGDRIPAEYARSRADLLNEQGVAVGVRAAQMSPEELARDQERKRVADRERQHDTFLMTTYQSVRDIESLRDLRLQQLADARRSVEAYVESLQSRLETLHARVQVFRPYNASPNARRMPDELAEDLVRTVKEVSVQRQQLADRLAEDSNTRVQFQRDIDRFKFLKARLAAR